MVAARGWDDLALRTVVSTVERGCNQIHDGPSFADSARWLAGRRGALDIPVRSSGQ